MILKPILRKSLVAILILLSFGGYSGGVYFLGFQHKGKAVEAQEVRALREYVARLNSQVLEAQRRSEELELRIRDDVKRVDVIKERVTVYVEPDKNDFCGPTVGVVSLLNEARDPGLSSASHLTVEEGRAPSGFGYTDQVEDTLMITQRYNQLMMQCNALIEWVEEVITN